MTMRQQFFFPVHKSHRVRLHRLYSYVTFRRSIPLRFSKCRYATSDTMLSKAFPIPNSNAIPVNVGIQIPVLYSTNAIP